MVLSRQALCGMLVLCAGTTCAQSSPVRGPVAAAPHDDIPLADYLGLLEQIAPAARQGAQAYLDAFAGRCGRSLDVRALRRVFSEGDGDPVLMQMIRASAVQDRAALDRLATQVDCRRGRTP